MMWATRCCAPWARFSRQLRNSSDMAARLGGEEFAVLCFGDINEQTLHDVAERIHSQIGKEPLATPKGLLRFTGSFGLALSLPDDPDWKTVYGASGRGPVRSQGRRQGSDFLRPLGIQERDRAL